MFVKKSALLFSTLLFVATIPVASGANYTGMQLNRPPVVDFTLTDNTGEDLRFHSLTGDATVVSFIFTRCPDICPVITQKVKEVEQGVESSLKINFISISVDPEYDSPEVLQTYMDKHKVTWPHLTGDVNDVQDVLNAFIALANKTYLPDESPTDAQTNEGATEESETMSVTIVNSTGSTQELPVNVSAYHLLIEAAYQEDWTMNISNNGENFVNGFNGINSPSDESWLWEVHIWNDTSWAWDISKDGIDNIDAFNHSTIAFAPNSTADDEIPSPINFENASVILVYPNGANETVVLPTFNARHMTQAALDIANINISMVCCTENSHVIDSIGNESNPHDESWFWKLYLWDTENETWITTDVGIDDVIDQVHIAWAPNTTDTSTIPIPESRICDGAGWIMGQGSSAHCMCDQGYSWPEDDMLSCQINDNDEPAYTVSHNTITYILDSNLKPIVAWSGDDWDPADVISDIHKVAGKFSDGSDGSAISGFTIGMVISALGLAIIANSKDE